MKRQINPDFGLSHFGLVESERLGEKQKVDTPLHGRLTAKSELLLSWYWTKLELKLSKRLTLELPRVQNFLITQPCCCMSLWGFHLLKAAVYCPKRNRSERMNIWLNSWVFLSRDWKWHQQHSITLVVLTEGQKSFVDCVCKCVRKRQRYEGSEIACVPEEESLWWCVTVCVCVCVCVTERERTKKTVCRNVCVCHWVNIRHLTFSTYLSPFISSCCLISNNASNWK